MLKRSLIVLAALISLAAIRAAPAGAAGLIDGAEEHTCAILTGGAVRCWGSNAHGELGLGRPGDVDAPASAGPDDLGGAAVALSAGGAHTCAILADGSVRCWGAGDRYALGYGNLNNVGLHDTPAAAGPVNLGGRRATALAAGLDYTCAIVEDGSVRCWGGDDFGQLGDAHTQDAPAPLGPVDLGPGRSAVAITAGWYHTCAILDNGTVRCWGANAFGQLGIGNRNPVSQTTVPGALAPVNLAHAIAITAGEFHTCALLADGTVHCWGGNDSGQLGYGIPDTLTSPGGAVNLGRTATAVAAGADHTCALLDDGGVRCWGLGANGQLGYASTSSLASPGATVQVGGTATAIAAGDTHTCALLSGGTLRCWGNGANGQLGYGNRNTIGDDETPASVGPVGLGGLIGAAPSSGGSAAPPALPPAPSAHITSLPPADGGTRALFTGGAGGTRYTWTFGDGASASCPAGAPVAGHVYTRAGTYTVGLSEPGAGTTTQQVAVSHVLPHADPTNATCGAATTTVCPTEIRWELIDAIALDGGCFSDVTPRPDPRARCAVCVARAGGGAAAVPPWFADATRAAGARMFSYAGRVEINGLIYTPHATGGIGGTIDIGELADAVYSASADISLPNGIPLSRNQRVSVQLPRSAPALNLRTAGSACNTAAVQALPQIAQLRSASGKLGGFTLGPVMTLKALDGATIVCTPLQPPGATPCPGAAWSTADGTLVTTNAGGLDPSLVSATLFCATLDQMALTLNLTYTGEHFDGTGTADGALPGVTLPALAHFAPDGAVAAVIAGGGAQIGPAHVSANVTVTSAGTTGTVTLATPRIAKLGTPALTASGALTLPNRSATPSFVVQGSGALGPYPVPLAVKVFPQATPVAITGVARLDTLLLHEVWGGVLDGRPYSYFRDYAGRDAALPFDVWSATRFDAEAGPPAAGLNVTSDYDGQTAGYRTAQLVISDVGVAACLQPSNTGLVVTWPLPSWTPTTNERLPNVLPCSALGFVRSPGASAAASSSVHVPRGLSAAEFELDTAQRQATLLGPRGERIAVSAGAGPGGFYALVRHPSPGVWRAAGVDALHLLVPARATVRARLKGRTLSYDVKAPAGGRVLFVDRPGGLLASAVAGRGTVALAPGSHTVTALVQADGVTLRRISLGHVRVPRRAVRPHISLRRRGTTLTIRWTPAATVAVALTDGRTVYRRNATALTVPGVPKRVGATVRVGASTAKLAAVPHGRDYP